MSWKFERVAGPFGFTEGPVWSGERLLFTDIPTSRILAFDPATAETTEFRTGTNGCNGLTLNAGGALLGCEGVGRRVVRYGPEGDPVVLADAYEGKRLNSPNDIVVDARGRIWFTDPRYGNDRSDMELDHESVYRLDPDGSGGFTITRVTFDTTRPNGLIVSPEMDALFVAQSEYGDDRRRELRRYPLAADGTAGECEVVHNFYPHRGIDGMRMDDRGHIVASAGWQQSGPGPMIYVFEPTGRVLETHPMPVNPTNCCFGDVDRQTLYVTAVDGSLFRARTDRRGLPYP